MVGRDLEELGAAVRAAGADVRDAEPFASIVVATAWVESEHLLALAARMGFGEVQR